MVRFLQALICVLGLSLLSCGRLPEKTDIASDSFTPNLPGGSPMHWLSRAKVSIFSTLPWGASDALSMRQAGDLGSLLSGPAGPPTLQPVALKTLEDGGMLAFRSDEMVCIDPHGKPTRVSIQMPTESMLIDVALAENGMFWGWVLQEEQFALIRWEASGAFGKQVEAAQWRAALPGFKPEEVKKIWCRPGQVLLSTEGVQPQLMAYDIGSGTLKLLLQLPENTGLIFPASAHTVGYAAYDAEVQQRQWVTQDLVQGTRHAVWVDSDAHGLMAIPLATDREARAYGCSGFEIGGLDAEGQLRFQALIENIAWDAASGSLLFSAYDPSSRKIAVARRPLAEATAPSYLEITIPQTVEAAYPKVLWRLAWVSPEQGIVLEGRDPRDWAIKRLHMPTWTDAPTPLDAALANKRITDQLQPARTWAVHADGSLVLPVLSHDALRLVRITF
jgi:hypothetical protein